MRDTRVSGTLSVCLFVVAEACVTADLMFAYAVTRSLLVSYCCARNSVQQMTKTPQSALFVCWEHGMERTLGLLELAANTIHKKAKKAASDVSNEKSGLE